jgi:hypothetical protein
MLSPHENTKFVYASWNTHIKRTGRHANVKSLKHRAPPGTRSILSRNRISWFFGIYYLKSKRGTKFSSIVQALTFCATSEWVTTDFLTSATESKLAEMCVCVVWRFYFSIKQSVLPLSSRFTSTGKTITPFSPPRDIPLGILRSPFEELSPPLLFLIGLPRLFLIGLSLLFLPGIIHSTPFLCLCSIGLPPNYLILYSRLENPFKI